MGELSDNFGPLTDDDFLIDILVIFAAFIAPTVAAGTIEGLIPVDLPDEAYGVLLIIAAEMVDLDVKREVQVGGGLYTVDQLADRFNIKARLQEAI